MVTAYVLIEMVAGHSMHLVATLKKRQVVKDLDRVTGPYDVIAVLEAPSLEEISDIVAAEIHPLPGVVRTNTCVAME